MLARSVTGLQIMTNQGSISCYDVIQRVIACTIIPSRNDGRVRALLSVSWTTALRKVCGTRDLSPNKNKQNLY